MRAAARERYRVYTQDEFFAADESLTAGERAAADECGLRSGRLIGRTRAHRVHRAAGLAMLTAAALAVSVVVAIDALPHAGSSRRRGALLRAAHEVARAGAPARSLSRARLPHAFARQSRRGGRLPRRGRKRARAAGSPAPSNRPSLDGSASRSVAPPNDREELARANVTSSSEIPTHPQREEFGFER
jgi:hypothetical protein